MKKNILFLVFFIPSIVGCKSINPKNDIDIENKTENTTSFRKKIPPKEFKKILDKRNVILIDVRTAKEVSQGKIAGSIMIDYYGKSFVDEINRIDKSKTLAVYCRSGRRSSMAGEILQKNGFDKIYELEGGFIAWQTKGFPVIKPKIDKD